MSNAENIAGVNEKNSNKAKARLFEALEAPTLAEAIARYGRTNAAFWRATKHHGVREETKERYREQMLAANRARAAHISAKAREARLEKTRIRKANLVEDVLFLTEAGEHPDNAAKRLGYKNPESLERALINADHGHLMAGLFRNDRMYSPMDQRTWV